MPLSDWAKNATNKEHLGLGEVHMRGTFKSLAIAIASLSLLSAPAYADLSTADANAMAAAITAAQTPGNVASSSDSIAALFTAYANDQNALNVLSASLAASGNTNLIGSVAAAEATSPAALGAISAAVVAVAVQTGNTSLIANVALASGNVTVSASLGTALGNNPLTTPNMVVQVLNAIRAGSVDLANAMGPAIVTANSGFQTAVASTGTSTTTTTTTGNPTGSEKSGQVNGSPSGGTNG